MDIGLIGVGHQGTAIATLLSRHGHRLLLAASSIDSAAARAREVPGCSAGTVEQAARFGAATIVSIPFDAWPQLAARLGALLDGRVVVDTGNLYAKVEGGFADRAVRAGRGSGAALRALLPASVRLAKGFNTISARALLAEADRPGERIGVPVAADDAAALRMAGQIVAAAGFAPVYVGGLDEVRRFDAGAPVYGQAWPASRLADALGAATAPPTAPLDEDRR